MVGMNRRFYPVGVGKGLKSYRESLWGAYEVPVLLALVTQVAHSDLMFYRKVEGAIKYDSHRAIPTIYTERVRTS